MMREILFRGQSEIAQKWVYGDLLQYADKAQIWEDTEQGKFNAQVIPETIGQYTGLTDKNGRKIFERDIITREFHDDYYTGVVYWADDFLGYCVKFLDGTTPEIMPLNEFYRTKYIEVIGNVHDNPELLKGERENV